MAKVYHKAGGQLSHGFLKVKSSPPSPPSFAKNAILAPPAHLRWRAVPVRAGEKTIRILAHLAQLASLAPRFALAPTARTVRGVRGKTVPTFKKVVQLSSGERTARPPGFDKLNHRVSIQTPRAASYSTSGFRQGFDKVSTSSTNTQPPIETTFPGGCCLCWFRYGGLRTPPTQPTPDENKLHGG